MSAQPVDIAIWVCLAACAGCVARAAYLRFWLHRPDRAWLMWAWAFVGLTWLLIFSRSVP